MDVFLNKVITSLVAHKKAWIILSILLIIIIVTRSYLSSHLFVTINVSSTIDQDRITVFSSTNIELNEIGKPGFYILPRNTKSILVKSGNSIQTQTDLKATWHGFILKNIQLKNDRNADKVAFRSTLGATCSSYGPKRQQLLYYSCASPTTIVRYETPKNSTWVNKKVADVAYVNGEAKPYRGGVIGLSRATEVHSGTKKPIVFTNEEGVNVEYDIPADADRSDVAGAHIFTDMSHTTNNKFVYVDRNGAIFLGKPFGDNEVAYEKIPAPENYLANYNQTLCTVSNDDVLCYRGRSPVGDVAAEDTADKITGYSVLRTTFSKNNISEKKIDDFDLPIGKVVAANGTLYGKSYERIMAFDDTGDRISVRYLAQNVQDISGGDTLRYIQNDGIFEYSESTKESYQVFYSPNITPLSLYHVDKKTFTIGSAASDKSVTYAYLLNQSDNIIAPRTIDLLPSKVAHTYSNDLVGNRLSVTLSNVYTRTATRTLIDNNKANIAKMDALDTLRSTGVNIDNLSIEFTY